MTSIRWGSSMIISITALAMTVLIFIFPQAALEAGLRGVSIWWDILFPALFPFFVISELLLGFGIVHFFGTLLDPFMRPLFRVPGIGGFVMAMGFASGYPVGARLTSQLWEQKLLNREEGERLVAFTSTSDPIFLIGAVAVGFFHDASLASILAISHYGSGVLVGLMMRFHGKGNSPSSISQQKKMGGIWSRAFQAMHEARVRDNRPLGILLKHAVQTSLRLVFVIGGLVVFFSAILELLTLSNLMLLLYWLIDSALHLFAIPPQLSQAIVNGLFEVTLGVKSAGMANGSIPLIYKVAAAAFILSWGGLSVHAQIVSLLTKTNLRYGPFILARFGHGMLSAILVFVLWEPIQPLSRHLASAVPVMGAESGRMPLLLWTFPLFAALFLFVLIVIFSLYLGMIGLKAVTRLGSERR